MEVFFIIVPFYCGLAIMLVKNPVYVIYFFILIVLHMAVFLFFLNLDIFAFILLVIYVGAIAILFVFMVMLLQIKLFERLFSVVNFVLVLLDCFVVFM